MSDAGKRVGAPTRRAGRDPPGCSLRLEKASAWAEAPRRNARVAGTVMPDIIKRIVIAALAALALTASAAAEVVYNRGNDGDPETLDPHKTSSVAESNILRDLLDGL